MQHVTLEGDPANAQGMRDRYRRVLAYVRTADKADAGYLMLKGGYAKVCEKVEF